MVFGVVQVEHANWVQTEPYRDSRRTEFGKLAQTDRALRPGERFHHRFARLTVCHGGAASRLDDNVRNLCFMPATPIRVHGGGAAFGMLDGWTESPVRPARRRVEAPGRRVSPTPVPP